MFSTCAEVDLSPAIPADQRRRIHQHHHAFGVAFRPSHQPVQIATQRRIQTLVPVHRPALAHLVPVRRQPSGTPHSRYYNAAPPLTAFRTAARKAPRCGRPPQSPPTDCRLFPPPPPSKSGSPPAYLHAALPGKSTSHPRQSPPPAAIPATRSALGPLFDPPRHRRNAIPGARLSPLTLLPSRYIPPAL